MTSIDELARRAAAEAQPVIEVLLPRRGCLGAKQDHRNHPEGEKAGASDASRGNRLVSTGGSWFKWHGSHSVGLPRPCVQLECGRG